MAEINNKYLSIPANKFLPSLLIETTSFLSIFFGKLFILLIIQLAMQCLLKKFASIGEVILP